MELSFSGRRYCNTISGALTLDLATGTALDVTTDASVGGNLTLTGDLDATEPQTLLAH